ncbi:putative bifunctional diguanylate cyclase/phosphodiesterase [Halomonadaceae bacterium KBTZ08]
MNVTQGGLSERDSSWEDRVNTGGDQGFTVLLVEDNPADADLCQFYLEDAFGSQASVLHASRLAQVEALLHQHAIDVALLDLGLPDSCGVSSVIRLRAMMSDIPIIVLTGNRDQQLGVRVIREHAQDFCAKQDLSVAVLYQSVRHAMERHRLQTQYARILDTNPDGMVVIADDLRVLFINQAATQMLGLNVPDDIGSPFPPELLGEEGGELALPEGRVAEVRKATLDWNDAPATLIAYHDFTERKEVESQLKELVDFDPLTGLNSRNHFFDHVDRLIAHVDRDGGMVAVLFLDLDRFKNVNDTMGHCAGDQLLRCVGERLRGNSRGGDFIARLGGDEFALVLSDIEQPDDAAHMAEKLIEVFRKPISLGQSSIGIGVSIGIATYPHCGGDAQALYSAADTAMYQAKEQGRNYYHFFSEQLQREVESHLVREQAVRQVAAEETFWVAYQPQVCASDGQCVGVEGLLRWPANIIPMVPPAAFIPILEDVGLIERVGYWVMEQAAAKAVELERSLGEPLRMAVNVSMRQLYAPGFYEQVAGILESTGLRPEYFEVELTESAMMADLERTCDTLTGLRRLGVSVVIDDFGTGYSSLSYLRKLPVDGLKIDRSFVSEIGHNRETEAIIECLLGLARALGLRVVAEGVENGEQQDFLRGIGCDYLQGFHIARPSRAAQFQDWLNGDGGRST